jgi:hypothetical protein
MADIKKQRADFLDFLYNTDIIKQIDKKFG